MSSIQPNNYAINTYVVPNSTPIECLPPQAPSKEPFFEEQTALNNNCLFYLMTTTFEALVNEFHKQSALIHEIDSFPLLPLERQPPETPVKEPYFSITKPPLDEKTKEKLQKLQMSIIGNTEPSSETKVNWHTDFRV